MVKNRRWLARGRHVLHMLRRYRRTARLYDRRRDWAASIYSDVVRLAKFDWLPARGRTAVVRSAALGGDVKLRVGSTDWMTYEEVALDGEYEMVRRAVDPAGVKLVVDLGANVGISCRLWKAWYPQAVVVGVEPEPANAGLAAQNAGGCAVVLPVGVGPSAGRATVRRIAGDDSFVLGPPGDDAAGGIPVVTVDDVLDRSGAAGPIDLLKCDIEGGEQALFSGGGRWLGHCRYLVVETHPPYTPEQLLADIAAAGGNFRLLHRVSKGGLELVLLGSAAAPADGRQPDP